MALVVLIWVATMPAFIVFWWKKRKARLAAGENYADDENYKKFSKIKRATGIAYFVLPLLIVFFESASETENSNEPTKNISETVSKKSDEEKLAAEKESKIEFKSEAERAAYYREKLLAAKKRSEEEAIEFKERFKEKYKKTEEKTNDVELSEIEKIKIEAEKITDDEILVKRRVDDSHDSIIELYILPKTVEPLTDGIIFEKRAGFEIKVQVKINGVDAYLQKYSFYNNNNFLESEDKIYYSEWDQDYYGNEESFHGDVRQYHITDI